MGEKGNLLDTSEEVFANLVEQGPQFWIAYEQYKQARAGSSRADTQLTSALRCPRGSTTRCAGFTPRRSQRI